jgi:hypothetical protein
MPECFFGNLTLETKVEDIYLRLAQTWKSRWRRWNEYLINVASKKSKLRSSFIFTFSFFWVVTCTALNKNKRARLEKQTRTIYISKREYCLWGLLLEGVIFRVKWNEFVKHYLECFCRKINYNGRWLDND